MSGAKRESNNVLVQASTLLLDIEGTTSSISFVKDVLFPYIRKHLEESIDKKWESKEFQEIIQALRIQAKEDEAKKLEGVIPIPESEEKDALKKPVIDNVIWQMDNDRKTKSLKDLQGLIMEEGYQSGDLKGHVYEDVEPSLKSWAEQEKSVYIYSSGSVHAQKLLFGHSEKGDLLPFIKGHFDTTVGMKGETASYKKILEEISCSPSEAAFLTDIPKEAKAAKEAGIFSILLAREGNFPLTEEDKAVYPVITSFVEIEFENSSKKRKVCTENDLKSENKSVSICVVSVEDPKLSTDNDIEMMEVEESVVRDTLTEEIKNVVADEKESGEEKSINNSKHDNNLPVEKKLNESTDITQVCKENISTCSDTVGSIPIKKDEEKEESTDKTDYEKKSDESKDISKKEGDEKELSEEISVKHKETELDIPQVNQNNDNPKVNSDSPNEKEILHNGVDKVESSIEKLNETEEKQSTVEKLPTEKSIDGPIENCNIDSIKTEKNMTSSKIEDNKSVSTSENMSSENQIEKETTENESISDKSENNVITSLSSINQKCDIEPNPSKKSVDAKENENPIECKTNTVAYETENKCLGVDAQIMSEEKIEKSLKEQSCLEEKENSTTTKDDKEVKDSNLKSITDGLHEDCKANHSSDSTEAKPAVSEAKCESLSNKDLNASETKQTESATEVKSEEKSLAPENKCDTISEENKIGEDNKQTIECMDIESQKETEVLEDKCDSLVKESSIPSENKKQTEESMEVVESVTQQTDTLPKQDIMIGKCDLQNSTVSEELMETDAQTTQLGLDKTGITEESNMKVIEPLDIPAKHESNTESNLISLKESNKTEAKNTSQEAEYEKLEKETLVKLETDKSKEAENKELSKETQIEAAKIEMDTSKEPDGNKPLEAVSDKLGIDTSTKIEKNELADGTQLELGKAETDTSNKTEESPKEIQVELGKIETETSKKTENNELSKETQIEAGKIETGTSKEAESNIPPEAELNKIETHISNKIENNKLEEETQVVSGKIETDASKKAEIKESPKEIQVELDKTETNTSNKAENNESAKETQVDVGKIKTNVPFTEKTEEKSLAGVGKDQETVPHGTSQNGTLSNGICANGTTSPIHNGECNGDVTSTSSLEKKCDATDTKSLETIVES